MRRRGRFLAGRAAVAWGLAALMLVVVAGGGCARLPYTTKVIHEDQRARVKLLQEVDGSRYAHPVTLTPAEVAAILRGFSLREQKSLPLRWFAEEAPPVPAFREDEAQVLAPLLADALGKAAPGERVAFEIYAPGYNPAYYREVTAGWMAVQDRYLHLTIEYFHSQQPSTQFSHYDWYYPTPPFPPGDFVLYFEPGRFWIHNDEKDTRGLDFREFLKSAIVPKAVHPASKP